MKKLHIYHQMLLTNSKKENDKLQKTMYDKYSLHKKI